MAPQITQRKEENFFVLFGVPNERERTYNFKRISINRYVFARLSEKLNMRSLVAVYHIYFLFLPSTQPPRPPSDLAVSLLSRDSRRDEANVRFLCASSLKM